MSKLYLFFLYCDFPEIIGTHSVKIIFRFYIYCFPPKEPTRPPDSYPKFVLNINSSLLRFFNLNLTPLLQIAWNEFCWSRCSKQTKFFLLGSLWSRCTCTVDASPEKLEEARCSFYALSRIRCSHRLQRRNCAHSPNTK